MAQLKFHHLVVEGSHLGINFKLCVWSDQIRYVVENIGIPNLE